MKAIDIKYDTSILDNDEVALPIEQEIPNHIEKDKYVNDSAYYAAIADYISSKVGCIVKEYRLITI